jgi:hypothetical protein
MLELLRPLQIRIVPVPEYKGMWRIIWPDGRQSPMGNKTRAVEAATMWAREAGLLNRRSSGRWARMEPRQGGATRAAATGLALG